MSSSTNFDAMSSLHQVVTALSGGGDNMTEIINARIDLTRLPKHSVRTLQKLLREAVKKGDANAQRQLQVFEGACPLIISDGSTNITPKETSVYVPSEQPDGMAMFVRKEDGSLAACGIKEKVDERMKGKKGSGDSDDDEDKSAVDVLMEATRNLRINEDRNVIDALGLKPIIDKVKQQHLAGERAEAKSALSKALLTKLYRPATNKAGLEFLRPRATRDVVADAILACGAMSANDANANAAGGACSVLRVTDPSDQSEHTIVIPNPSDASAATPAAKQFGKLLQVPASAADPDDKKAVAKQRNQRDAMEMYVKARKKERTKAKARAKEAEDKATAGAKAWAKMMKDNDVDDDEAKTAQAQVAKALEALKGAEVTLESKGAGAPLNGGGRSNDFKTAASYLEQHFGDFDDDDTSPFLYGDSDDEEGDIVF